MENTSKYHILEEILNAITHGIGALLAAAALALLVVFASLYGNIWHVVSFSIYGATLVILYLFSTLYHSFQNQKVKSIFKLLDHSAIYIFIAGTYTPFALVTLRGTLGWAIFGIIWGLAIGGVVFKLFFVKRFKIISTLTYILMGWVIVFAFKPLAANLSIQGVSWLILGGIMYTAGSLFYLFKKIPYNHVIFHIFVLCGSLFHFFAILFYVLPLR
ncbi:MAG: hypothetical protein DDT32_01439 [Syntrophomonadaceae bacterium]|nr:hypothetical protein [Bacillota bacterium]